LASGEKIGCFGLTEPDFGSNPGGMITKLRRLTAAIYLNGAKMWITNGTIADVAVVWAKLDGVVRGFLVEKGTKGYTAPEMKGKHSLRASVTSELIFDNVLYPKIFFQKLTGLKNALMCLKPGTVWNCMGSCRFDDGML
jgi:glutaryl-CoA dehydrogenase